MLPGRYLSTVLGMALTMSAVPAHAETFRVTIEKLDFSPKEINAKVGDTVEWINKDILAHTATVKGDWDVMIAADKSASLVLSKAGAFDYFCKFHPNMKGRITVAPATQ
jgi:plastocyanin